eukprot:7283971-Heterocapsa_arctica.AAC.1
MRATGPGPRAGPRVGPVRGIPFLRSEWCRDMERCPYKGKPRGCAYAHAQSDIDEVNAERV